MDGHRQLRRLHSRPLFSIWFATALLLIITLIAGATAPALTAVQVRQPDAIAAIQPNTLTRVIVQSKLPYAELAALIATHGGRIIREFSIIDGVVAEVPAAHIQDLSQKSGITWVSIDAPVASATLPGSSAGWVASAYIAATGADKVWSRKIRGRGVTVAVLDSGITDYDDFKDAGGNLRIRAWVQYSASRAYHPDDYYGHGSHVAGIIGGNGALSQGAYRGMAPEVGLVNVKISDDQGMSRMSDVVAGLEWVLNNKDQYNIRVVNLSLNSTVAESYHVSPLAAACEILWFNGIVVVVSAGNNGTSTLYPPANDPFVITVGAINDMGTAKRNDDMVTHYSAFGTTSEGITKPEIVAPGHNVVSLMGKPDAVLAQQYPERRIVPPGQSNYFYFRMSGTSMSSAVVAGAVALLLQQEPHLTPDQVKYRLMATADKSWSGYDPVRAGAGALNIDAAVKTRTTQSANTGLPASQLLWTGSNPVNWGSVNWGSVNWGSVNWGSVNWGSVNWGSVNWGSDYWGE